MILVSRAGAFARLLLEPYSPTEGSSRGASREVVRSGMLHRSRPQAAAGNAEPLCNGSKEAWTALWRCQGVCTVLPSSNLQLFDQPHVHLPG